MSGYAGFQEPRDTESDFNALSFLVKSMVGKLATTTIVEVVGVQNAGDAVPVGLLDVRNLVNQVDPLGNPEQHGTIHNLPYFRMQGGKDAIIMDPKVGDLGIAMFCSRDTSGVKRARGAANPGSSRRYDWADGIYIGGILNGAPQRWIRFYADGIDIHDPTGTISLRAPHIEVDGILTWNVNGAGGAVMNGNFTINGNLTTVGTLQNNGHDVGSTHRHINSGGTGTGGVPQ